jgi:hypothetical protein
MSRLGARCAYRTGTAGSLLPGTPWPDTGALSNKGDSTLTPTLSRQGRGLGEVCRGKSPT